MRTRRRVRSSHCCHIPRYLVLRTNSMSPLPAHHLATRIHEHVRCTSPIDCKADMLSWHAIPYKDSPLFLLARVSDFRYCRPCLLVSTLSPSHTDLTIPQPDPPSVSQLQPVSHQAGRSDIITRKCPAKRTTLSSIEPRSSNGRKMAKIANKSLLR